MKPPSVNAPCHCGSGKKFKHCHGSSKPPPADTGYVTLTPIQSPGGKPVLMLTVRVGSNQVQMPLQPAYAEQLGTTLLEHARALMKLGEKPA